MYFFLMAASVAFLVGIITNEILRKNFGILLKDAENMDHTGNDFLKRIRVKYENYIRTGHEIKNTEAFAEKYLDRFRIYGIKAHSFEKLSAVSAGMCVVFGVCGAMLYPKNRISACGLSCNVRNRRYEKANRHKRKEKEHCREYC